MKRFDVYSATGFGGQGKRRLVVVLQHPALEVLDTVVVAPLFKPTELPAVPVLRPMLTVEQRQLVVAVDRMAAVPRTQLGKAVGNLEPASYELLRAVDLLFSGF